MEATDLAWAAGVIDGEGSILFSRTRYARPGYTRTVNDRLYLKVSNTDVRMLRRLQEWFGGRIYPVAPKAGHLPAWEWNVNRKPMQEVLRQIRPYLVIKGEQADVALELETAKHGGGRGHKLSAEEDAHRQDIKNRLTLLKRQREVS